MKKLNTEPFKSHDIPLSGQLFDGNITLQRPLAWP